MGRDVGPLGWGVASAQERHDVGEDPQFSSLGPSATPSPLPSPFTARKIPHAPAPSSAMERARLSRDCGDLACRCPRLAGNRSHAPVRPNKYRGHSARDSSAPTHPRPQISPLLEAAKLQAGVPASLAPHPGGQECPPYFKPRLPSDHGARTPSSAFRNPPQSPMGNKIPMNPHAQSIHPQPLTWKNPQMGKNNNRSPSATCSCSHQRVGELSATPFRPHKCSHAIDPPNPTPWRAQPHGVRTPSSAFRNKHSASFTPLPLCGKPIKIYHPSTPWRAQTHGAPTPSSAFKIPPISPMGNKIPMNHHAQSIHPQPLTWKNPQMGKNNNRSPFPHSKPPPHLKSSPLSP
ncbi:hypothetical protein EI77_04588 [Prosthecobacter fusiformis]|uniref:Uncharacterized protein n=1 Tax=Prosthecobacter fusiformis TaxID=48464 RepID=A0A4R7RIA2_9BACT|nr:hypothetical protein EI77_04588 [Prosthecobacter fusiformis]